jgi:hypothetical protein
MLMAIRNLREIQQRCLNHRPLDPKLADWLGQSLGAFLDRQCESIDLALGLSAPQGGVPWWLEEGIRARNAALRELACLVSSGDSLTARARRVRGLSVRYGASAWLRDRQSDIMPAGYEGSAKECLWRAFKSGAAMPVSERHLRDILAP